MAVQRVRVLKLRSCVPKPRVSKVRRKKAKQRNCQYEWYVAGRSLKCTIHLHRIKRDSRISSPNCIVFDKGVTLSVGHRIKIRCIWPKDAPKNRLAGQPSQPRQGTLSITVYGRHVPDNHSHHVELMDLYSGASIANTDQYRVYSVNHLIARRCNSGPETRHYTPQKRCQRPRYN